MGDSKVNGGGNASAAAAATAAALDASAAKAAALAAAVTAAGAAAGTGAAAVPGTSADDDERPVQSFEGPEKLLEIWWMAPPPPPGSVAAGMLLPPGSPSLPPLTKQQSVQDSANPKIRRFGLRLVSRQKLETMLETVKVSIINAVSNEYMDAYLLSESSMFVYPFKIVLKTCGTTTLLKAIHPILNMARDECGLTDLNNVFYSRKNFMDPSKQLYPHTSFSDECKVLDEVFNGSAYVLGPTNGDHWYLYMTDRKENESVFSPQYRARNSPTAQNRPSPVSASAALANSVPAISLPPSTAAAVALDAKEQQPAAAAGAAAGGAAAAAGGAVVSLTSSKSSNALAALVAGGGESASVAGVSAQMFAKSAKKADQTLELLMTELDQTKMRIFEKRAGFDAKRVTAESGIGGLYSDALIDDFVFDPQGYSMNGLRERGYFTIHITPQPNCSYASFETNINPPTGKGAGVEEYRTLIAKNLTIFGPGRLTVTLFCNDAASEQFGIDAKALLVDIPGYIRTNKITYEFENYRLSYCHYRKENKAVASPAAHAPVTPATPTRR